jgi:hypothetical protein
MVDVDEALAGRRRGTPRTAWQQQRPGGSAEAGQYLSSRQGRYVIRLEGMHDAVLRFRRA